ncbi:MAG: M67 family metallopeptidase [Acidobacteria bacterium]|nr:M67 family metallopeptidase [Acidobacteriota bacterium]
MALKIARAAVAEMLAHARESAPAECCGLAGAPGGGAVSSIYRLRNVARAPLTSYEAAPQELFDAQRRMRERGESLAAIYHSHPRAADPVPSESDVRLAYYPEAVHLIVGLGGGAAPVLRAFRLFEGERRWERVEYEVVGE